jgi:hypothetical protein
VNQTFARHFSATGSALGRAVHIAGDKITIVGEVKDSKYDRPMQVPVPYFYLPFPRSSRRG